MRWPFEKWEGAGNDFVLLDARHRAFVGSPEALRRLGDRHFGVGCDQLLVIGPPRSDAARLSFGIWNTDGSRARQCGNGARCVAAWAIGRDLLDADGGVFDSPSGSLRVSARDGAIAVDMGAPRFQADVIPFIEGGGSMIEHDGRAYPFTAVSMGNPHAVIFVDDVLAAPVESLGAALQRDARFPAQCNVEFVAPLGTDRFAVRVFERGVGETLACGSGACAVAAVAWRAGRSAGDTIELALPGGTLCVRRDVDDPARLWLSGPATHVFDGEIEL